MQFPYTYFEDEVRDGFYVPGMMKRAWAAQLEVLDAIRKVCEKHDIQYFAEWGTLLGAVRHKGFIPWDDDMDICMKREDYNKFLSVAEKELPEGYRLMSFRNDDYWEMLTRVLNGTRICFDEAHLAKFHGFPFVAGMDVFPLDFLATDEEEEILRDELVKFVVSVADSLENADMTEDEKESKICEIEKLCNVTIDRSSGLKRQLYILIDQLFSLYSEEEAEYVTVMPLWLRDGAYKYPKSYYQETVMLPFENTYVPAPAAYDAVLRKSYGDYMESVRAWDTHEYPFYKRQEEQLAQYGIKPHKYVFSADELNELQKGKRTMKKTVKKQALEMVSLLKEAHNRFRQAIDSGNTIQALRLLERCQGGAISLGSMIENSEGEGTGAVRMLEEYCEMVYQIHEDLAQGGDVSLNKACGNLQRQMQSIGYRIAHDMKVRIEAVFLPYKASMWDSLESVWRTAEEDPDCDAYVVPIPYYDKNADGSFRKMHYEGEQYPDDVPVIWYEDYDFAGRQPDMIFIHNPYDEYNYVTSVHPFFYAKNLKQFTSNLIYIPYFILDEINPKDERAIQGMEHFVTVPGVIHADKVIVQSEGMRRAYVNVLSDFAGEDTRKIWEEKILGLGSPKLDKVQEAKKGSACMPDGWREVIEKPDGSRKKIVLYNTGVSALLEHNGRMLERMKSVFTAFRENQEELALLWRPHPLIQATLESMRPHLWNEYRQLVEDYCAGGWGIYDDSADLDRAVALSDAYYGDGSSVALLCRSVGMPVIIQDVWSVCGTEVQDGSI